MGNSLQVTVCIRLVIFRSSKSFSWTARRNLDTATGKPWGFGRRVLRGLPCLQTCPLQNANGEGLPRNFVGVAGLKELDASLMRGLGVDESMS